MPAAGNTHLILSRFLESLSYPLKIPFTFVIEPFYPFALCVSFTFQEHFASTGSFFLVYYKSSKVAKLVKEVGSRHNAKGLFQTKMISLGIPVKVSRRSNLLDFGGVKFVTRPKSASFFLFHHKKSGLPTCKQKVESGQCKFLRRVWLLMQNTKKSGFIQ